MNAMQAQTTDGDLFVPNYVRAARPLADGWGVARGRGSRPGRAMIYSGRQTCGALVPLLLDSCSMYYYYQVPSIRQLIELSAGCMLEKCYGRRTVAHAAVPAWQLFLVVVQTIRVLCCRGKNPRDLLLQLLIPL
jgi:hypothetical protein